MNGFFSVFFIDDDADDMMQHVCAKGVVYRAERMSRHWW